MPTKQLSNRILKVLILIATLSMSIGYASINSVIVSFNGKATAKEYDGVFITKIKVKENINADSEKSEVLGPSQTILKSSITLSSTDSLSSITYEITVYNSNDKAYYYDGVDYLLGEETYSNENIEFNVEGIEQYDLIQSKESKNFTITFRYKDNSIVDNKLNSYIIFLFKPLTLAEGINNIEKITESNSSTFIDFTGIGGYNNLYGGNDGDIKYSSDGAMVFGDNYPILYRDIKNQELFAENISVYLTIKTDVMQSQNTSRYPISLVSVGRGDGTNVSDTVIWIGLYQGYLHIYTYRPSAQSLCLYCNYSHTETSFISYDVQKYANKKFNIQVVATKAGITYLYINGSLVVQTQSGSNDNLSEYITIGDLRPMRNLKYEGYMYDYSLYDRLLTDDEILLNWLYAKDKWGIDS